MAGPFLVPCNKALKCPSDDKLYVKHVILNKDIPNPQLREVKNCLMINQLLSEAGGRQNLWNKLLIVEFSSYYAQDEINAILSKGVEYNGSQHCFLGFSASQLRTKTCFLINETDKEIIDRRAKFGILSNAISFTDRVAKIQHMFEPFERSLLLNEDEFKFESNVGTNLPSGFMSPELAETIKTTCGLPNAPSVVQIICPGFSGKLVRCDEIASAASKDILPSSGLKALLRIPDAADNCGSSLTMGIADCAKPYKMGYLDVFSVMFLDGLGVEPEDLLELQSSYHDLLEKLGKADLTSVKYFLRLNGRKELLSKIENGMTPEAREKICKIKSDEIEKMQDQEGTKLRVLVPKSREVFGIVDPYHDKDGALTSDECVFVPCLDCLNPREREEFENADQVLVIPVPCYTSSGIRVLKLVRDKGEYENLRDCLVLPSPTEEQVVANKYFVCWDENLIAHKSKSPLERISSALPSYWSQFRKRLTARLPCSREQTLTRHRFEEMVTYHKEVTADGPSAKSKLQENKKFQNDLKEYFSTFKSNDGLVSQARSLFEKFASHPRLKPSCSECQKLGEYLSPDFAWNATSYDVIEKYLTKLEKKFEELSCDHEEAQDSATQASTPQPVWKEMTAILNNFIAPSARQNGIL